MAIGISKARLDEIIKYKDKTHDLAGTWKMLADSDDRYAKAAFEVIANPTSFYGITVRNNWKLSGANFEKFGPVGDQHQNQYLRAIGKEIGQLDVISNSKRVRDGIPGDRPARTADGLLLFPKTSFVEVSYAVSVEDKKQPPPTAIDLVLNKMPAGIDWYGHSPVGLGLEPERISEVRNYPKGMSASSAAAHIGKLSVVTVDSLARKTLLHVGKTPTDILIPSDYARIVMSLATHFKGGNRIRIETSGGFAFFSNPLTGTVAMMDGAGKGKAFHHGDVIEISPDNFRKNQKGGFDIRLDNGSWTGAGLDESPMERSFVAIEQPNSDALVKVTSGAQLVASLVDHTAGELTFIETVYKGRSEDTGVASIGTVRGRSRSIAVLDGNASAAPEGVRIGPNQFYIDKKYPTLDAVGKATGTSVSALLGLNSGLALASGSALIKAGTILDLPKPVQLIDIVIDTNPQAHGGPNDEGQAAHDVRHGFVENSATSKISFSDNTLNKTDFTSTQMGSLATGGVRPGEFELDPNAKPGAYLGRFYLDPIFNEKHHAARMNSAVLNGLSAMTTVNTYIDPIVLDLIGAGVRTLGIENGVLFDVDHSGTLKRTGWTGTTSGILVVDDGSGSIKDASQMFSEYFGGKAGSNGGPGETRFKDSLGALRSVDANHDGVIDCNDPIWNTLRVWVDWNRDGKSDPDDLMTFDEWGIREIQVKPVSTEHSTQNGNEVLGRGTFKMGGVTREWMAVNFLADPLGNAIAPVEGGARLTSTVGATARTAFTSTGQTTETLDAAKLGVDNVYAGMGDTTLIAAPAGSWLVGGGGSNTYRGNAGDDVFVISARDDPRNIHGNGGRDTAIIVGERGMTLDMAQAGLTIVQGGCGNDVIFSGGNRSAFIKGGLGNTTIVGGAGNDVLVGGSGHNTIIGGSGKAVIYAGPKGDTIYASAQGSIIHAGGGADRIFGSASDDVIEAGRGNAVIDGGGGTNVVTLHGEHGDYTISGTETGYTVVDRHEGRDGRLSLKNVQKVTFSDISVVDLAQPNPMPVPDALRVDQAGLPFDHTRGHRIGASQLLANDLRFKSEGPLRLATVGDAVGGTVSLTQTGDLLFTPDPSYAGVMSFKYGVVDAVGHPSATVVDHTTGKTAPMRATVTLAAPDVPIDPLVAQQWYLSDTNVIPVWRDYTGKGIRLGQFEPGGEFSTGPAILDAHHPDLVANIDPAWLEKQKSAGKQIPSVSNHATMVAGVMVAAKNGQGIVGVAHGATLGGHALANSGADLTGLSMMINYDIANHSWSFANDFAISTLHRGRISAETTLHTTMQYAADNGRGGLGTVMVAVSGNARAKGGSAQGSLIGNSRYAIEVGAINAQSDLSTLQLGTAPFSNPGASLLVSAPGSRIVSTSHDLQTDRGSTFGRRYSDMQGTSFAAPIVSGIVALMLEANPNLGYRDVQTILALSARRVSDTATRWAINGAHNWNGGGAHISHDYGFGNVDARAAVRLAESWSTQSTGANIDHRSASSGVLNQRVTAGKVGSALLTMQPGLSVEHAEIDFDANVGRLGDLTVKLVAPNGTESILLDRAGKVPAGEKGASDTDMGSSRSGEFKYTFMSTRHWGEQSEGAWKLEVVNAATGAPVTLNNWSLRLYGNGDPSATGYTYFYTDEFGAQVAEDATRATLDDLANRTPRVDKTINAAAVSKDTDINLDWGVASIGGTPLTIMHAGEIRNIVTGDGNDVLTASSHQNAVLDGGRGSNTLRGSSFGMDWFVVHRRSGGLDTIENFEVERGEVIDLVGFKGKAFKDLALIQQGADVKIDLGDGQSIVLKDRSVSALSDKQFLFQDRFVAPAEYDGRPEPTIAHAPSNAAEIVVLNGGGEGVGYLGSKATLFGTIYSHGSAASDCFVIRNQPGAKDFHNALRGFRHGVDKIDLRQTGIARFSDLSVVKRERIKINGIAPIHGVGVSTRALGTDATPVELLYLDALDPGQVTESDFIFAAPGQGAPTAGEHGVNPPGTESVVSSGADFSSPVAQRIRDMLVNHRVPTPFIPPIPHVPFEPIKPVVARGFDFAMSRRQQGAVDDTPSDGETTARLGADRLFHDMAAFAPKFAGATHLIPPQPDTLRPLLAVNRS